jgi:flavin reductase (DIM6/NTAB) family NADH-FMN oxidoreductase RutF
MTISSEAFREALRFFPAGVTLVTTRTAEGHVHGMTVSAFASVSPQPPLIVISIDHEHTMHDLLQHAAKSGSAVFGISILAEDQQDMSNRFAFIKDEDRFDEGEWTAAVTGAPLLVDSLAWLDCRLHSSHQAGSHTLYVGEVQASSARSGDHRPLVYWNRGYRHLREPLGPKPADGTLEGDQA